MSDTAAPVSEGATDHLRAKEALDWRTRVALSYSLFAISWTRWFGPNMVMEWWCWCGEMGVSD